MIAGSLNRFVKNGRTACGESGPPRFIKTIARRGMSRSAQRLVEDTRQLDDMFDRRFRQDAVTKIKNVRTTAQERPQLLRRALHRTTTDNEQHRVEITLHHDTRLQLA